MKILLTGLILSLAAGCSSKQTFPTEKISDIRKRVETKIAQKILKEVRQDLPKLKGSIRSDYLQKITDQFRQSVDLTAINIRTQQEFQLLKYITAAERIRWHGENYENQLRAMSSLKVNLPDLEALLISSLANIDSTLAELIGEPALHVHSHMQEIRDLTIYPEDSVAGRQAYLDALEREILSSYKRWQHAATGKHRDIELRGLEKGWPTFYYENDVLTIGLNDVEALPYFELASIAAFYGYPGRAALSTSSVSPSLKSLLQLPAFKLGWAWYRLDKIIEEDIIQRRQHLYFSKLMTISALADLRLNTTAWSKDEAANNIYPETPYTLTRINNMLTTVQNKPGYYLSAFAGKTKLTEIESRCISNCRSTLPQRLIALGPLPFDLLEERLVAEGFIQ